MPISEKVADVVGSSLDNPREQENKNGSTGPPRKGNPSKFFTLGTGYLGLLPIDKGETDIVWSSEGPKPGFNPSHSSDLRECDPGLLLPKVLPGANVNPL